MFSLFSERIALDMGRTTGKIALCVFPWIPSPLGDMFVAHDLPTKVGRETSEFLPCVFSWILFPTSTVSIGTWPIERMNDSSHETLLIPRSHYPSDKLVRLDKMYSREVCQPDMYLCNALLLFVLT